MYERFYGLRERPFDLTPNPRYLVLTDQQQEALSHLEYALTAHRGITVLTGEAGTGKTTLVHAALEEPRKQRRCVYMTNPVLTRQEFFEFLAWGFGLDVRPPISKTAFLLALTQHLVEQRDAAETAALIVDEAQCLSPELLEEIRLLTNIETPTDKLLQVVLVGQPELSERLNEPSTRPLKQRIALRCILPALDARGTADYIANRVRTAGGEPETLFTPAAIETIGRYSRGIARTISVICDNALVNGFAAAEQPVGRETVVEVCRDFDLQPGELASGLRCVRVAGEAGEGRI